MAMSLSSAPSARSLHCLHHAFSIFAIAAKSSPTSLCMNGSRALRTQPFVFARGTRNLTYHIPPRPASGHTVSSSIAPDFATPVPRQQIASFVTDVPKYYGPCPFKCLNRDTGLGPAPTFVLHGRYVRWKSTDEDVKDVATKAPESLQPDSQIGGILAKDHKPTDTRPLYERIPEAAHNVAHRFHRPTKEELLAAASGFWARLRVRFKWATIRSARPFNADEIGAFFSWIVLGHVIWIILGTTTFVSLLIFAVNTVFAQETLARWIGNYLTKSVGVKVVFESAIVPKWKDGVITFKNVFISRRPGLKDSQVSKGSSISAAAAAAAAAAEMANERRSAASEPEEDTNYTQYDLSIETINVTLSFSKWFNGKGPLRDVEMKGVRGVVDRTHVVYSGEYVDPRTYKHEHQAGDFEIESFKLEDLLVSIYQPHNFRPYSVSIFTADLPQLRKQWLFYDLLSANHVSGSFDGSLFTIHPRQIHNLTGAQLSETASEQEHRHWKKHSRIRMDGLKIDHLNRGVEGPFSWIHEGNVDVVADIAFPAEDDDTIVKVMSDFYEKMEHSLTTNRYLHTLTHRQESSRNHTNNEINNDDDDTTSSPTPTTTTMTTSSPPTNFPLSEEQKEKDNRFIVMDLRIHLNGVHAFVPLFTHDLSYVSNALVRPIVAYINNNNAFIPVNCRVVKRLSEFDGSWTVFDSGLMEDMSRETYEAFARDVVDDGSRGRRLRKVGMWSLGLVAQALFLGLAGHLA